MKTCTKCGGTHPKSNFRNKKDSLDRLHPWCIPCCKEYARGHYQENKQDYIDKAARWSEGNPDQRKKISSEYKKNNRAYYTADTAMYRAFKDQRTPKWLSEFDLIKIKCLYQVAAMYARESEEPWHVDHVVPLRGKLVSGLHVPWNLRVIPGEENIKKGNKFEG